jgi:hypothetical protein
MGWWGGVCVGGGECGGVWGGGWSDGIEGEMGIEKTMIKL